MASPYMVRVAALQMISGDVLEDNLAQAEKLIQQAADAGAECIVLPENFALFSAAGYRALAEQEMATHYMEKFLSAQCRRYGIWLLAGTMPLCQTSAGEIIAENKVRSASLLFNAQGEVVARYDKMHLFDVQVNDKQGQYHESATIAPGSQPVLADTPFGQIGLSVCYDLRFPELYRFLAEQGAEILCVPSAFTQVTGEAHWEILLRARAIENQCYVIGCNQGGLHPSGRETFGGSCIIDPWGRLLAKIDKGIGWIMAEIELEKLREIRQAMPVLEHRKI